MQTLDLREFLQFIRTDCPDAYKKLEDEVNEKLQRSASS